MATYYNLLETFTAKPFEIKNYRHSLGSLNKKTLKIEDDAKDILFNEISRRYWIIKLEFGNGHNNTLYYAMQKPILSEKKALPDNVADYVDLLETKQLNEYGEETEELIFKWTLSHPWKVINRDTLQDFLNEVSSDRAFYFQTYWNIAENHEFNRLKAKGESEDEAEDKARRYVGNLFTDPEFINGEILRYQRVETEDDAKTKEAKSRYLSVLYWIYYIFNLKVFSFSEKDFADLEEALTGNKTDASYKWPQLNYEVEQFCLKGFNREKIIQAMLDDKANIDTINKTFKTNYFSVLERFAESLWLSLKETKSQLVVKTLYWNLYLNSKLAAPALSLPEFCTQLEADILDLKANPDHEKTFRAFYTKYLQEQETQLLHSLIEATEQESKEIDKAVLKKYGRVNLREKIEKIFSDEIKVLEDQLKTNKARRRQLSGQEDNEGIYESLGDEIRKLNRQIIDRREKHKQALAEYTWLNADYNILYAAAEIEKLENSIDSLKIYPQYITRKQKFIMTYDDLRSVLQDFSTPQMVTSLKFNFNPTRVKKEITDFITVFDPTLDLAGELSGKPLLNGLDSQLLNAKIAYLLHECYNDEESTQSEGAVKVWRPEHRGWIAVLQFYFQVLSISNGKIIYNPNDWETDIQKNTVDLYLRCLLQYFIFHKLKTGYVLLLGDGNDGKSDTKSDLMEALGDSYVYLNKTTDANQFTDGYKVNARAEFLDDNGVKKITEMVDRIKAESTVNSWLTYEVKKDKDAYTRPSGVSIMVILNEMPWSLLSDYSVIRRVIIFKTARQQDRKVNGIQQDNLFKIKAKRARYYLPVILNTFAKNAAELAKTDSYGADLFSDTEQTAINKTELGTGEMERYLISLLVSTYKQWKDAGVLAEKPVIKFQNTHYFLFSYPAKDLFQEFNTWNGRLSPDRKWKPDFQTFMKTVHKFTAKTLWRQTFSVILPDEFKRVSQDDFDGDNQFYLLLPVEKLEDLRTFAVKNNCAYDTELVGQNSRLFSAINNTDIEQKHLNDGYELLTYGSYLKHNAENTDTVDLKASAEKTKRILNRGDFTADEFAALYKTFAEKHNE